MCGMSSSFLTNIARTCESLYPRPKILVINYPHNPTATVVERPFFEEIVALAKKYRFFVIHDFAYGDIGFDGYQPPSFLSVKGAKSVGCEFTTMSKGYNMAGWRVGFAAGNRDMLGALKAIKGYYDYGIFQAVQVGAIVALRHGEAGRLAQVAEYQLRRDALVRGLKRMGWAPAGSPGGDVCVDGDSRTLAVAIRLDRLRHEAPGECQRGRQSRARLRRDRRRLPPPRAGGKRAAAAAGGPPGRARYLRPEKAVHVNRRCRAVRAAQVCRPWAGLWLSWCGGRAGADGRLGGLDGIDPAEDHPAGACLEHARDRQAEGFAQVIGTLLGDDHRAVVEVADALSLLFAALQELDRQALAGKHDRLHRVGQIIQLMTSTPWRRAILLRL